MAQNEEWSSTRPPACNLAEFSIWKARIKLFMNNIDEEIFSSILTGLPTSATTTKSARLTDARAMNILAQSLSDDIFQEIVECSTAKEMWDSLHQMASEPVDDTSEGSHIISFDEEELTSLDVIWDVSDDDSSFEDEEEEARAKEFCLKAVNASNNKEKPESELRKYQLSFIAVGCKELFPMENSSLEEQRNPYFHFLEQAIQGVRLTLALYNLNLWVQLLSDIKTAKNLNSETRRASELFKERSGGPEARRAERSSGSRLRSKECEVTGARPVGRKAKPFLPKAPVVIILGLGQGFNSEVVYEGRPMRPRYTFLVFSYCTMRLCLYGSRPRMHVPEQSFWTTQLEYVVIADEKVAQESKKLMDDCEVTITKDK
ncbi:hypothetical protein KSP39_PZI020160 [Platanthera zijinensis]|uniref:Uncharacterized protein n=1 Tax=Platanthera zijinensis TaxID=2320716 RepID=A0AAP0B077_9ASPA